MKIRITVMFLLAGVLLGGCASIRPLPDQSRVVDSNHIYKKNYSIDKKKTTFVGNPMIEVKDYYVRKKSKSRVSPTNDFTMKGGIAPTISGEKGSNYPLIGLTDYDGTTYRVAKINKKGILVSDTGAIFNRVIGNPGAPNPVFVAYSFNVNPDTTLLKTATEKSVQKEGGFKNYKIIYSGVSGKSIKLSYREFSPDDLARPAFYQDLSYSADANVIRFRNYKIRLHEATNQKITFTVLQDGLEK